jgi:hypothetical protein
MHSNTAPNAPSPNVLVQVNRDRSVTAAPVLMATDTDSDTRAGPLSLLACINVRAVFRRVLGELIRL